MKKAAFICAFLAFTTTFAEAQTKPFKGNEACKAKYPAAASYMESQWKGCTRAPTPGGQGESLLKAWQCWCRKG